MATAVALAILLGLGTWQLRRLAWKSDLIAMAEARVHAPPVPLSEALAQRTRGENPEYRHVRLEGRLRHDLVRYLYAAEHGDWGWDVVTPMELPDGGVILVNRGYIPHALRDSGQRDRLEAESGVALTGLIRLDPGAKPWYLPLSDAQRRNWYWPEIEAMLHSAYPAGAKAITMIYVDADPVQAGQPPAGGATRLTFSNRHLEYAVTWYLLAATLAVIYGIFAYRRLRRSRG
jgi:surfeit locus 1 family protein